MQLGPPKPRARDERPRRPNSFTYFWRILGYARLHLRLLVPGLVCIVLVAASSSVGLALALPVLQAIIRPDSVPVWIYRTTAAQRLHADLDTFISDDRSTRLREFDHCVELTRLDRKSPLRPELGDGDVPLLITGYDGERHDSSEVYRRVARGEGELRLDVIEKLDALRGTARERGVPVRLGALDWKWRAALWAADRLPAGNTRDDKLRALIFILGAVMVVQFVGAASRFGGEYLTALVAGRMLLGVRRQMYRKALRLPVSFFAEKGTADIMSRFVQDSQAIYRGLTYIFVQSLREPLKAIGAFAVALIVNWQVTLLAVLAAPPLLVMIRSFGKSIRKRTRRLMQGYGRMLAALEGSLIGIRVVKGYGGESYERRHLYETDWQMYRAQAGIERIDALTSPLFEFLGYIFGAAVTVYFANEVMSNRLEPAEFMLICLCLVQLFDPVRKLSGFYNRISAANAAAERVFEIIDMPDELAVAPARGLPPVARQIEFRDVTYQYSGAERPAVAGVNLVVRRGERVAIVGPNGSGKTTLLGLLMRFFEPRSGQILFDDVDVRSASLQSLRRQIGLVTQDSVMFADTVRANIAYGEPSLLWKMKLRRRHPERGYRESDGDMRVIAAAKAAFAHEFITQLPESYDNMIGEHGATLSGGQKQRIAIARAILADAPILIFDEATSQIDADSEHKIHQALHDFLRERTAFIIAHRFSTILEADRIVVMDAGRIVDSGKHAELLNRCPLYKTLFETQMNSGEGVPSTI